MTFQRQTRGRILFIGALLFVATLSVWRTGYPVSRPLPADAHDYAQMGRELARGHGFATLQLFPRQLPYLAGLGRVADLHWPNLHRFPLTTVAVGALVPLTGESLQAGVLQSGLAYAASVPVVFATGASLGGIVPGLAAAFLFAGDPVAIERSFSGMSESLSTLFVLMAVGLSFGRRTRRWHGLVIGVLCGLAYLGRSQLVFVGAVLTAAAFLRADRGLRIRAALPIVLGMLLVVAPWWIRNASLTGDPLFSFFNTRAAVLGAMPGPSDLSVRLEAPVAWPQVLGQYGEAIGDRVRTHFQERATSPAYWIQMLSLPDMPLAVVFALSYIVSPRPRSRRYRAFKGVALALVLANFLSAAILLGMPRFFAAVRPIVAIVVACELDRAARRWLARRLARPVRGFVVTAAAVLCALSLTLRAPAYREGAPASQRVEALLARFAEVAGPRDVVVSDLSYLTATRTGHRSIRLPDRPRDLLEIDRAHVGIDYVLLSPAVVRGGRRRSGPYATYRDYARFVRSRRFLRRFEAVVPPGPNGALFRARGEDAPAGSGSPGQTAP